MFKLGDKVRDGITGFEGIIIAQTNWLNGCSTCGVKSQSLKDGLPTEIQWFDDPQLVLVEDHVIKKGKKNGGLMPTPQNTMKQ